MDWCRICALPISSVDISNPSIIGGFSISFDILNFVKLTLSKQLSNAELSDLLAFISGVLQVTGADRFRVRAYDNAGAALQLLEKPWYEYVDAHEELEKLPGIGKAISEKLQELRKTGTIKAFEGYVADVPAGMRSLMDVAGIGPKKAFVLAATFDLTNEETAVDKLLALAQAGKLETLPHFGEKSQQDIIDNILAKVGKTDRMPFEEAKKLADTIVAELKKERTISNIEVLGSLRREADTVGDIDLGAVCTDTEKLAQSLKKNPHIRMVLAAGEGLLRLIWQSGHQIDLKISPADRWGAFIQHFTGSKIHNIKLRELALQKGLSLSEHGIKDTNTGETKHFASEEAFYNYLGLNWIPPQERLGTSEIERYTKDL